MRDRYLTQPVLDDLRDRKMVFIGGPRQVGKTTLASELVAASFAHPVCLNWDNRADRKTIMASAWPGQADLVVLDEFHKYRRWKTFLKGEYDKLKDRICFVVSGGARLDVFRRGGDSLQGRYHHYRLHPFSVAELAGRYTAQVVGKEIAIPSHSSAEHLSTLEHFGGFPEPFVKQSERFLRRWHSEKLDRLLREDVRDTTLVRDLGNMKLLSDMLPDRVGSLFSANALRGDLEVSHNAVLHWLDILETFYYHFRIYPLTSKKIKSLRKEPKLYLWDWSELRDPGARFENLVAAHLLKFAHWQQDREGYRCELFFLRDLEGREVDFVVTVDAKPWFAVEVKLSDTNLSPALRLFKQKWNIPFCYQVVRQPGVDVLSSDTRVISAGRFLGAFV
jgi:predicted AAA+ superfamily ATPase